MADRFSLVTSLLIGLTILVPHGSAWMLPSDAVVPADYAAWTTDLVRRSAADNQPLPVDAFGAVACPMGDINVDGVDDILVRAKSSASGSPSLKALNGPTFVNASWEIATSGNRLLQCAPDLDGDGAFDPVTALASDASGSTGGAQAVANEARDKAMQVVDGRSGASLINRVHQDTKQGTDQADAGVEAASEATANLLPAVQGAEAFLKTELQQTALTGLPVPGLPIDGITAKARHTATMQLLDVQGSVEGTITLDDPGVDPLAIAPLPVGGGLPQVSALTAQAVNPVKEASSQVPTLSLYNPDGTLAWATQLAPGQGLPMLVPRAGDLDLDGVQDLIVENVPTDVSASATGQFQVISGLDGSTILDSGAPINGLAAALPLGTLSRGVPGILSVEHLQGAAEMTLSVVDGSGSVVWTATADGAAVPINVRPDAYTGDPLGFTDLTGDGLADVGLAVPSSDGLTIQTLDGASGKVAWAAQLPGVASVVPLSTTAGLAQVTSAVPTLPTDLLAVGASTNGPALSLVSGATGQIVWSLSGNLPAGAAAATLDVMAAGDLDGDGVQDVLATLTALASAPPVPAANGRTTLDRVDQADEDVEGQAVYAVSGHDGETIWSAPTDPANNETAVVLEQESGPAFAERQEALEESQSAGRTPGLAASIATVALLATAWLRRRRRL